MIISVTSRRYIATDIPKELFMGLFFEVNSCNV